MVIFGTIEDSGECEGYGYGAYGFGDYSGAGEGDGFVSYYIEDFN